MAAWSPSTLTLTCQGSSVGWHVRDSQWDWTASLRRAGRRRDRPGLAATSCDAVKWVRAGWSVPGRWLRRRGGGRICCRSRAGSWHRCHVIAPLPQGRSPSGGRRWPRGPRRTWSIRAEITCGAGFRACRVAGCTRSPSRPDRLARQAARVSNSGRTGRPSGWSRRRPGFGSTQRPHERGDEDASAANRPYVRDPDFDRRVVLRQPGVEVDHSRVEHGGRGDHLPDRAVGPGRSEPGRRSRAWPPAPGLVAVAGV